MYKIAGIFVVFYGQILLHIFPHYKIRLQKMYNKGMKKSVLLTESSIKIDALSNLHAIQKRLILYNWHNKILKLSLCKLDVSGKFFSTCTVFSVIEMNIQLNDCKTLKIWLNKKPDTTEIIVVIVIFRLLITPSSF